MSLGIAVHKSFGKPTLLTAFIHELTSLISPAGYRRLMKQVCEAHDNLYVLEKVVSAKDLTSGYMPLAATLISDRIVNATADRRDGALLVYRFNFSDHTACAVANANIEVIEREDLCARVRRAGPYFEQRLKTLDALPIVGNVRGSHFMLCIKAVRDRGVKAPFADHTLIGKRIARSAQSRGLIVRPVGNMYILPPALTLCEQEIDQIVAILRDSIEATMAALEQDWIEFAA